MLCTIQLAAMGQGPATSTTAAPASQNAVPGALHHSFSDAVCIDRFWHGAPGLKLDVFTSLFVDLAGYVRAHPERGCTPNKDICDYTSDLSQCSTARTLTECASLCTNEATCVSFEQGPKGECQLSRSCTEGSQDQSDNGRWIFLKGRCKECKTPCLFASVCLRAPEPPGPTASLIVAPVRTSSLVRCKVLVVLEWPRA